jgi:FixJ family two-component response regulator
VSGQLNIEVALDLWHNRGTAKVHRFNVMRKMRADSYTDLVEMARKLVFPRGDAASRKIE